MFLHTLNVASPTSAFVEGRPPKPQKSYFNQIVSRELNNSAILKNQLKDVTSSKINVKGPKQADAMRHAELLVLRNQLAAFPEDLNESARKNYLLKQNNEKKNLQDSQCLILVQLDKVLKNKLLADGEEPRKYRIGGTDKSTYERFFKVEPKRWMSKAQLITALRLSFGSDLIKSEYVISQIFNSFDFHGDDKMDWRAFLYTIMILMQPTLTCEEMLRSVFALYCSVGSFDLNCTEKLTLGVIRHMICIPVQLSYHAIVQQEIDTAWEYLLETDNEILQYVAKKQAKTLTGVDPHDIPLSFAMFQKLLKSTHLHDWISPGTYFGTRDQRMWSSYLEETYYHPTLLHRLKAIRRELRNEDMKDQFIAEKVLRYKKYTVINWKVYAQKRTFLRYVMIGVELRSTLSNYTLFINHWRHIAMEYRAARNIQRVIRGFLARKRRSFIARMQQKVIRIQSHTRQLFANQRFRLKKRKLNYAATMIQRMYRGKLARRRVKSMIEAFYDTRKRQLARAKRIWEFERRVRAIIRIQMVIRRFLRRRRMMQKLRAKELRDEIEAQIAWTKRQQEKDEELYKQNLAQWYITRKSQYDETHYHARQSVDHQKRLLKKKFQQHQELLDAKKIAQEIQTQRAQEDKIEKFLKSWETEIQARGENYRKKLHSCLVIPESPEELILKKEIIKKIKDHLKEVLRRADKAKIPMEIPEGYEISTREVIEMEVQKKIEEAKQDMKQAAWKIQKQDEEKVLTLKQKEKDSRQRNKLFSIVLIQKFARRTLARMRLRKYAMKRFSKFFERELHDYYYQDNITKLYFWEKPKSLGEYDVDMEDHWVVVIGKTKDGVLRRELDYFYNPATWQQTWELPTGTIRCDCCNEEFAKLYYPYYTLNTMDAIYPGVIRPPPLKKRKSEFDSDEEIPDDGSIDEADQQKHKKNKKKHQQADQHLSPAFVAYDPYYDTEGNYHYFDPEHALMVIQYPDGTATTTPAPMESANHEEAEEEQANYHHYNCFCIACFESLIIPDLFTFNPSTTVKDIHIRLLEGGSPEAMNMDLDALPTLTWYNYLLTQQNQKKLILLNEEEELALAAKEQEDHCMAKSQKMRFITCQNCYRYPTFVYCHDCGSTYCAMCNEKEHPKKDTRKFAHKREKVEEIEDGGFVSQRKGLLSGQGVGIDHGELPPEFYAYDSDEEEDHRKKREVYETTQQRMYEDEARKAGKKAKKDQKRLKKQQKEEKRKERIANGESPDKPKTKKKKKSKMKTTDTDGEESTVKSKDTKGSKAGSKAGKKKGKKAGKESEEEQSLASKSTYHSEDTERSATKKKDKKKLKKKASNNASDTEDDSKATLNNDQKQKKKKKKKKKHPETSDEDTDAGASHSTKDSTTTPTKKKKKKEAKTPKDHTVMSDTEEGTQDTNTSKPKKSKTKTKKKTKEVSQDERNRVEEQAAVMAAENTTLPDPKKAINQPLKESKEKINEKEKEDRVQLPPIKGASSSSTIPQPQPRPSSTPSKLPSDTLLADTSMSDLSTGAPADGKKKKKSKTKSKDDGEEKPKKKKKKKKSTSSSSSEDEESDASPPVRRSQSAPSSSTGIEREESFLPSIFNKTTTTPLESIPEKKKKKKKKKDKELGEDTSGSRPSTTSTTKKKKDKDKKKKKNEDDSVLSNTGNSEFSSLSGYSSYPDSSPEKQKVKKKKGKKGEKSNNNDSEDEVGMKELKKDKKKTVKKKVVSRSIASVIEDF